MCDDLHHLPPHHNILSETLVRLSEAPQLIPSRPSPRTVWRWVLRGSRGRRLETVLIGGSRFTSREAIERFLRTGMSPT